ncbi:diguanylate cyclase [Novosphingobium sp. Fuku2-ISO-50]|uniref:diguanylate cyclase n=1 Tax=Novosphingobium sp. Fuku2-ISO-50 TaxID=1739114 RepID=UPI0009E6A1BD|nr:diguanylate cyclase [Novosphingobium sp. Fuku2-ISO-50]
MAIPNLSGEQMRTVLKSLEQALYSHEQWAEALYGALICRLEPDQRDVSSEAHRLCRFGQWYYTSGIAELGHHPGFLEIGLEHERMHQHAADLLRASMNGLTIPIHAYERFGTALKRLRLEFETLEYEIHEALVNLDPLTGTPNRAGMLTKLREEREQVSRGMHNCAVVMMDLDLFKTVNDQYGHRVGDRVLSEFSYYVMAQLRPYDKVFRYGGEEFLICLPDTDLETGWVIIERLREGLAALLFDADGGRQFQVTASFGITLLDPRVLVERSIDRADKALYAAKGKGRNCVVTWDVSMDIWPVKSENPD